MVAAGLFSFDHEQLIRNAMDRKKETGVTFRTLSRLTGIQYSRLADYMAAKPRVARRHLEPKLSAETAVRLMMWLEDYDIRDYLLEEK